MILGRRAVRPVRSGSLLLACLLLTLVGRAPAGAAEVVSAAPDGVRLTLYRADTLPPLVRALNSGRGLALVTETRTVDLPAGPSRLAFEGVVDTLVPQTLQLQGLPGAVSESDFDYDLLSAGSLVAKSIGSEVQVVRTDPRTGRIQTQDGVLRSGPDGVMLQTTQGVEALRCSGLPEKLIFSRAPQGLAARPTLSIRTTTPQAGRYRISLSYLATGFDWSATYVASLAPDGRSLALDGWLTLQNGAATGFVDAPTDLVAGRLARTGDDEPVRPSRRMLEAACWRSDPWWRVMQGASIIVTARRKFSPRMVLMEDVAPAMPRAALPPPPAPPPMAKSSDLGDYKLYTLPEPTTVAASQTKQIRFLARPSAAFERFYVYQAPSPDTKPSPDTRTRVTLAFRNMPGDGLGEPLPSGRVAIMAPAPGGRIIFAAGDHLDDTPIGLPFELSLGRASQVQARAETGRIGPDGSGAAEPFARVQTPRPRAWSVNVALTNTGEASVVIELRQPRGDDLQVTSGRRTPPAGPGNGQVAHHHAAARLQAVSLRLSGALSVYAAQASR